MPNIKSAKKRVRVAAKKTLINKARKSELKTVVKKFNAAAADSAKRADAEASYRLAVKKLDQSVANGILHKNNAARKKSALAKKMNSLKV